MRHPPFLIRLCLYGALFVPSLLFAAIIDLPESEATDSSTGFGVISEDNLANNPKAWNRRGLTLFREGRYHDALFAFNQAILLKEDDPEAWNYKGEALFKLERQEEALAAFKKALEIRPLLTRALHNKGAVLLDLDRLKEALAVYKLLIQRNASDAVAWKEKAEVLLLLGRDFEALDAATQALDVRPGFQEAEKLKEKIDLKIQNLRFNL